MCSSISFNSLPDTRTHVTQLQVLAKMSGFSRWVYQNQNGVNYETNDKAILLYHGFGELARRAQTLKNWFQTMVLPRVEIPVQALPKETVVPARGIHSDITLSYQLIAFGISVTDRD